MASEAMANGRHKNVAPSSEYQNEARLQTLLEFQSMWTSSGEISVGGREQNKF